MFMKKFNIGYIKYYRDESGEVVEPITYKTSIKGEAIWLKNIIDKNGVDTFIATLDSKPVTYIGIKYNETAEFTIID